MPVVTGLFSEVDPARTPRVHVDVTTAVHATRPTMIQFAGWCLAVLLVAVALAFAASAGRDPLRTREPRARWRSRVHPADAVVVVILIGWWVLSPTFFDDGWVVAREREFSASQGFSNYYDSLGVNLPNGYWLEWLQHFLTGSTDALLALRGPSLLCLLAAWVLCRWTFDRGSAARAVPRRSVGPYAMAGAFLVGAMAWGMTLRPEPVTALLTVAVLACAVAFHVRPRATPLVIAAVLVPLTLTAHHAGVVVVAPLLAILPALWKWARTERWLTSALVTASTALLLVLFSLGADVAQRMTDAADTAQFATGTEPWYLEYRRYEVLGAYFYATPLRHASVAVFALVAASFLLRTRQSRDALDVPSIALLCGLGLLLFTPSKHPWHFGALLGVAAVAAGGEALRLEREARLAAPFRFRPLVLASCLVALVGWTWWWRRASSSYDLVTLDWRPAFESTVPLVILAALIPIVALFIVAYVDLFRHGPAAVGSSAGRVVSWSTVMLTIPVVTFAMVILTTDSVRTASWTLTRQNLGALTGNAGCGVADQLRVAPSPHSREAVSGTSLLRSAPALVFPDTLMFFPCARLPHLRDGVIEPPAYLVSSKGRRDWRFRRLFVVYSTSPLYYVNDLYSVELLGRRGDGLQRFQIAAVDRHIEDAVELPPVATEVRS